MLNGYTIHSRLTFEGMAEAAAFLAPAANRDQHGQIRRHQFFGVLLSVVLRWSPRWALLPVFFVTPRLLFRPSQKWLFDEGISAKKLKSIRQKQRRPAR